MKRQISTTSPGHDTSCIEDDAPLGALRATARARLLTFAALLTRWNSTIRLISRHDLDHLWVRHIEDALQLAPYMPEEASRAVDLGSGAGLPGLILAIATGVHFDLIEADSRKAAFLQEAAAATQAPVTIHTARIESTILRPCRLVTARALAPLPKLLELAHPFLDEGGICLFPKGQRVDTEIADAHKDWTMGLRQISSRTEEAGCILRVSGLSPRTAAHS